MDFSDIRTRNDLADYLGIKRAKITHVLYIEKVDTMYSTFCISKKSGGVRIIHAPNDDLKQIQRRLAEALWKNQVRIWKENNVQSHISYAFQKGKSIVGNASRHRKKRFIVNIDLEDFFDSFHFGRVRGFFIKNLDWNLTEEAATVIAQLTCYKGTLPQGAPTSPIITNMICNIMDMHILGIAKRYKLTYTRYADDMTFSTNDPHFVESYKAFYEELAKEISKSGFRINEGKTRVLYRDTRQEVTGLVVNNKISVRREYCKVTQAMAHSLYTGGKFFIDGSEGTIDRLEGRFSFIDQIEKYNNIRDDKEHNVRTLNRREKKYQEFLFYKLFCAGTKPLIVTEGKTDILYLKGALRKMYQRYPGLVEKTKDGWTYKMSFLRRTDKLCYFFNFSPDGADTVQNIYNMYTGLGRTQVNYYKRFREKYGVRMQSPVILLFDNEFVKDGPVKKFAGACKCDEEELRKKMYLNLIGNLYVQVVPSGSGEPCEIEDLFDEDTLNLELSGRKFDRTGKADMAKFYNKDVFSKHIVSEYEKIDFSGFIPLLDTLEEIISDYSGREKDGKTEMPNGNAGSA